MENNAQLYGYLTLEGAARFLSVSKSYLYKLTSKRLIPFHKPTGKLLYFKTTDLQAFLEKGRVATTEEIQAEAKRRLSEARR
jgi:excisionase family DNA binding protein